MRPIGKWKTRIMEKCKSSLNDVPMATFSDPILFGCVWRCSVMGDSDGLKERRKSLIFTSVVTKDRYDGCLNCGKILETSDFCFIG